MRKVILFRAATIIPLLFFVSIVAFSLTYLLPGDDAVAILGVDATPEQIQALRTKLHLDDGPVERYGRWLGGVVQGDFGKSALTDRSVTDELKRRIPITGTLAIGSLILATIVGMLGGLLQGAKAGKLPDKVLLFLVSLGLSTPGFWVGTLLVTYFAVKWKIFPALGYVSFSKSPARWLEHSVLPMITLALFTASEVARQLRTGLVGVLDQDYIRAARSRGLSSSRVVGKHALKNAALPTITIIGVRFGFLLAGSVIVENIFNIPGLGSYVLSAIQSRDVPIIQAVVMVSATVVVTLSLLVDIAYAYLNPKVRVS